MAKGRRGWRQARHRLQRALRRAGRRTRFTFMSSHVELKLKLNLDADADYDVHVACDEQLTSDRRYPPHAPSKKMDEGYKYGPATLDGYLAGVRARLRAKGRNFDYDHPFAVAHLSDALIDLEGAIVKRLS